MKYVVIGESAGVAREAIMGLVASFTIRPWLDEMLA